MVLAIEVPTLPPSLRSRAQQADGGAAQFLRDVKKCRDIQRREDHRKPGDDDDARPDDLPGTDLERQLRHPVVANAHRDQARGHEIARIDARDIKSSDEEQHHHGEDARGREDQSGSGGIVAKERLQQARAAWWCWRRARQTRRK